MDLFTDMSATDSGGLWYAADLARLAADAFRRGEVVAPELVEPAYLRNNVALTLAEQKALRASRAESAASGAA